MTDSRSESGSDERAGTPREVPPRRRSFEGGSGVVPSSFQHDSRQAARDFEICASSVRDQAASLANRAVVEGLQEANDSILEEPEDDDSTSKAAIEETVTIADEIGEDNPWIADDSSTRSIGRTRPSATAGFVPYTDSPDVSVSDLIPTASQSPSMFPRPNFDHTSHHDFGGKSKKSPWDNQFSLTKMMSYVPAVAVGTLLNILDGLSYGMILSPLSHIAFAGTESIGSTSFYISTIIAQLVFSLGGSGFKACIGSEMIEIVPFFHAIAFTIASKLSDCSNEEILATTVATFAVSCIVTGLTFFLLGWLKLGAVVGFFPMHILLGCIGGVGWFLAATGVEVSARIEGGVDYNLETLKYSFRDWETIAQWGSCLASGCLLMYCERKLHHPLVVPTILVATFALFHIVIAVVPQLSLEGARASGWVFPAQSSSEQPWWYVYTLYRPSLIHFGPSIQCFPVMLALTFFGLIHVPINIPALAAATKEDTINVNRELIAHGSSNTLSGLCGSIQNYLVYTNSVMFVKSGADGPLAGVMSAFATAGVMIAGPGIIGYIPVIVVASLIFMMGFDLITEALVDTYGKVRKQDYATMVIITLIMGCYDFVVGIVAGIMLACLFFVITSARRSPVQSTMTGSSAHSTVIRHPVLQKYLDKVGKQVFIMRLSGALFFGTNGRLEREVRKLSEPTTDSHAVSFATIRYSILDLENVNDIDYCTVDTFMKIKRSMDANKIRLVLSGAETAGHKIRGLRAVDLVPEKDDPNDPLSVQVFATLNIALSWCENQFIKEYYQQRGRFRKRGSLHSMRVHSLSANAPGMSPLPGIPEGPRKSDPILMNNNTNADWNGDDVQQQQHHHQQTDDDNKVPNPMSSAVYGTTPRSYYLRTEAKQAAREDLSTLHKWKSHSQPLVLLMQIVESVSSQSVDFWANLVPYSEPRKLSAGEKSPSGFHLVESGSSKIRYDSGYYETAVAGTALGDLTENVERRANIVAETETKSWSLKSLTEVRKSPDGKELALELLNTYLAIVYDRYQRMTDYYRIAD